MSEARHTPARAPVQRALAAVALALALGLSYGDYGEVSLALVVSATLLLVLSHLPTRDAGAVPPSDDDRAVRTTLGFGIASGLAFSALTPPGVLVNPSRLGGYVEVLLCAGLLAATHLVPRVSPRLATARFVAVMVAFVALSSIVLSASPSPAIDVFRLQQEGGVELLRGVDPYTASHLNPYGPGTAVIAPELLTPDGTRILGYPYPPLGLVLSAPFAALGDVRAAFVLCTVIAAWLVRTLGRGRPAADLAATFVLLQPRSLMVMEVSWTEPLVLLVTAAVALALARVPGLALPPAPWSRRRTIGLGLLFGLLLASKQYALLLAIPLVAVVPSDRRGRVAATALVVALATLAPFAVHDPAALFHGLVTFHWKQPFRSDALTLLAAVVRAGGPELPAWPSFVLAGAVAAVAARRTRDVASALSFAALAFLLFVVANKQAGANYYWLAVGLLCTSIAAASRANGADAEHATTRAEPSTEDAAFTP